MSLLTHCKNGHDARPKGEQCPGCKRDQWKRDRDKRRAGKIDTGGKHVVRNGHGGTEEGLDPVNELARLIKKHSPTTSELQAVQDAARAIHAFLETRGMARSAFEGEGEGGMSDRARCGNCRFFGGVVNSYGDGPCQRHSPAVDVERGRAVWPWTQSGMWCGDHEPKSDGDSAFGAA